ncbi:lipid-A-disaccharide synthase N-terminal domain-containing protein [Phycisphaerales bacterium AB-hyl4]|uniref:Lipid-A-disaccharide synthase N-terminal domain-containing protein n=1 Tax=Natronomicrosphaera hydrolytica TaxID=3242702 RepID=A0ABV4UCB5_9BACT
MTRTARLSLVAALLLTCTLAVVNVGCDIVADNDVSNAIDLHDRLVDIELHEEAGQQYIVLQHNGEEQRLTPAQYMLALQQQRDRQRDKGWLFVLFNITSWVGVLWVALGLSGQLIFTGRMILQWLASEKERRSVVPPAFWWMSLIGASMLLAYFMWRKDIVGVIGQGGGWLIYARNLWMIHRPAFVAPEPDAMPREPSAS